MPTAPTVKFQVEFNLNVDPPTFVLYDRTSYTAYGSGTVAGLIRAVGPDGLIFYKNVGFDAVNGTTGNFNSPDIAGDWDDGWAVLKSAGIELPLDENGEVLQGQYTFQLRTLSSEAADSITGTLTFIFDAVMPVPEITMAVDVDNSELTVTDDSTYAITNNETVFSPATTVYDTTIKFPEGTGISDVVSTTKSKVVTPIYTGVFTATIETTVSYTFTLWSGQPSFTVNYLNEGVKTTPETVWEGECACIYYNCSKNLFDRYLTAKNEGPATTLARLLRNLTELSFYWAMYKTAKACGEDSTYWCEKMYDLLRSESCDCSSGANSDLPVEIIPIGQGTGSGGDTYVGTVWLTGSADPSDAAGANGDFYIQSADGTTYLKGDIFYKISGAWGTPIMNTQGDAGDTGVDGGTWLTGTIDPGAGTGADGDFYLQSADGDSYAEGDVFLKVSGAWVLQFNIMGVDGTSDNDKVAIDAEGTPGYLSTVLVAKAKSGIAIAEADADTLEISMDAVSLPTVTVLPKTAYIPFAGAGTYGTKKILKDLLITTGANGADGSTWLTDDADPDDANGADGDFFLQTKDGVAYLEGDIFLKVAGAWVYQFNISGQNATDEKVGIDANGTPGYLSTVLVEKTNGGIKIAEQSADVLEVSLDIDDLAAVTAFGPTSYVPITVIIGATAVNKKILVSKLLGSSNSGSGSGWTQLAPDEDYNNDIALTNTITTANLTGYIEPGMPLKFWCTGDSAYRYAIVESISANTIVISGDPLVTGTAILEELYFGSKDKVFTRNYVVGVAAYNDTTTTTLLEDKLNIKSGDVWMDATAKLVKFGVIHKSDDSTVQPYINIRIGSLGGLNPVCTANTDKGLVVADTIVYTGVNIDYLNNTLEYKYNIEIDVDKNSGTEDAAYLTVFATFIKI